MSTIESFPTTESLAELATTRPAAARVFHRHGIDFCCGGKRGLREACAALELDSELVWREIQSESERPEGFVRWDERPLAELIEHILERFHAPLREELPRLISLAHKVEAAHHEHPERPRGLAEHLERVLAAVEEHLEKEEQVLFPLILSGRGAMASMPIHVMRTEHDEHAANLARNREITRELALPADACTSWKALYAGLEELERELKDHIHLENNVLFPRALAGAR